MLPEFFTPQKLDADFACTSTTGSPMHKWMPQADSAHQIGPKPILHAVLILVESGGRGGRINAAGIFHSSEIGRRFCLYLNNQQSHRQMDSTGGFNASNRSRNNPPHCSNCRLLMLYKVVKKLWAEFLPSDFGDVLANLATTNRAMDKWMLRLDSAGQKGPEIILQGILIVVEGCFTAERTCGSGLTETHCHQWLLSFYTYPANCPGKYLSSFVSTAEICRNLLGLCVRKYGNRGAVVVVVVQIPIGQILLQLESLWLFYLALLQPNQHS